MPHPDESSSPPGRSVEAARRLFSRPERVRPSQFLRREIASRMRERLDLIKISPRRIIDAGCGEGCDAMAFQQDFAEALVLGIDGAVPMLQAARDAQREAGNALKRWLAGWQERLAVGSPARPAYASGDFGMLPFAGGTADLIWSNLALHWHPHPEEVFTEWRRVLKTDGLLMFSCFGPDTFKELRAAFERSGDASGVMSFADMHDLGDMLVHAGFSTPVMDMETITLTYPTADRLLADVRAFGGNPLPGRRQALGGRTARERLGAALETMRRADGRIHLTVEVLYGHAFVPQPARTSSGDAIVRFQKR